MTRRRQMRCKETGKLYYTNSNINTQSGSGIYDKTVNALTGSNLKDGERHSILYTNSGFKGAHYNGPQTRILENLREGLKGINETDVISKYHDIRYSLAKTTDDVRYADEQMIRRLNEASKNKSDYKANIAVGYYPIKAKMKAEDLGIIKKGSFAGLDKDNNYTEADLKLLKDSLAEGEKLGYGKKTPILKGKKSDRRVAKLKKAGYETKEVELPNGDVAIMRKKKTKRRPSAWNNHVSAVKKKNKGKKFSEILKLAAKSYKK